MLAFRAEHDVERRNEWCFYLKPEATRRRADGFVRATLQLTMERVDAFGLEIREVHVLSADYLARHQIMPRHYAGLYGPARRGRAELTARARTRFREIYGEDVDTAPVLGGFEILERFPGVSEGSLYRSWPDSGGVRLAPSVWCARLHVEGREIFVLNGFVPRLLRRYVSEGCALAVFTVRGDLSWHAMRDRFVGYPDPSMAAPGSVRNALFLNRERLAIPELSLGANGAHCSAGPIETVIELVRLTSDLDAHRARPVTDLQFGRKLRACFAEPDVDAILQNPRVRRGGEAVSICECTEGLDEVDALEIIRGLGPRARPRAGP
jgi:hypothetical protein